MKALRSMEGVFDRRTALLLAGVVLIGGVSGWALRDQVAGHDVAPHDPVDLYPLMSVERGLPATNLVEASSHHVNAAAAR